MDKKKTIDLIKLEVLGSIKKEDAENLKLARESDEGFPFKEFGEYQNLVALLPLALKIEYPSSDLKDKTALKLYSIRDQIKAKLDAKKAKEEPPVEAIEEETIELEKTVEEEMNISEDYAVKSAEQIPAEISDHSREKEIPDDDPPKIASKQKETKDKELIEKTVKDSIKIYMESEVQPLKKAMKRNMILSIALFVVALILIILVFFLK